MVPLSTKVINISKCTSVTPVLRLLLPYQKIGDFYVFEGCIFGTLKKVLRDMNLDIIDHYFESDERVRVEADTKRWKFLEEGNLLVLCKKTVSTVARDITAEL